MKQIDNTLYIQTQGIYLRLERDTLKLELERETRFQMPLHHLNGIVAFGNVLVSPFLIHRCARDGRSIVWLSERGQFQARLTGPTTGNVLLRQVQHRALNNGTTVIEIARRAIAGKLQNARGVLTRAAREAKETSDREALTAAAKIHADTIRQLSTASNFDALRGLEGYAARAYFGALTYLVRRHRDAFALSGRSARPPRDRMNSLLSFLYTLLANECASACESVGLDPQVGFFHALRPGRPALALDLMEELRAPLADRLALTLINRAQLQPDDFSERPGGSVYLTESGRKTVLIAYQKRKQEEVFHPVLERKIPFGLVPHVQARLLARYLRGDLPCYQPYLQR